MNLANMGMRAPVPLPLPQSQSQSQPQPQAAQNRKQHRPMDKSLHRKVAHIVPESALFGQLRTFEERLDRTLMRKKLDFNDATLTSRATVKRTLRLFVSNMSSNQSPSPQSTDPVSAPAWTLRVEGRLVSTPDAKFKSASTQQPKFSSFFSAIRVELQREKDLFPTGNLIRVCSCSFLFFCVLLLCTSLLLCSSTGHCAQVLLFHVCQFNFICPSPPQGGKSVVEAALSSHRALGCGLLCVPAHYSKLALQVCLNFCAYL